MDPGGDTIVPIAAEFFLDAPRFLRRNSSDRKRRVAAHGGHQHLAGTCHRREPDCQQIRAACLDDQTLIGHLKIPSAAYDRCSLKGRPKTATRSERGPPLHPDKDRALAEPAVRACAHPMSADSTPRGC